MTANRRLLNPVDNFKTVRCFELYLYSNFRLEIAYSNHIALQDRYGLALALGKRQSSPSSTALANAILGKGYVEFSQFFYHQDIASKFGENPLGTIFDGYPM